ncbi:MAG: PIN domain-containing protein [Hyphomonadaceae bacterium]|nr:PIN domain-containing protein [Hyphomonadaceae bacterium]
MIVVDTNVLSELMRPAPAPAVVDWLRRNAKLLLLPTVAIGELRYGVARLAAGKRKLSLTQALDALVDRFADAILAYDLQAADCCGDILAEAESAGRPMALADAQIAAIARVARAELATRNASDFATTRLVLIDPWAA